MLARVPTYSGWPFTHRGLLSLPQRYKGHVVFCPFVLFPPWAITACLCALCSVEDRIMLLLPDCDKISFTAKTVWHMSRYPG